MDVYRESLLREVSAADDFLIRCWPEAGSWQPEAEPGRLGSQSLSRLSRAVLKYSAYARRVVKTPVDTSIVHLLDHSMAHLLPAVPSHVKTLVTVHDLIPLRYPGGLTPAQQKRYRRNVDKLAHADALIAVSEFTKWELVAQLGIAAERIRVVPNGVKVARQIPEKCAAVKQLRAAGADVVLLSVGTCLQRKNLHILPAAMKAIAERTSKKLALLRIGDVLGAELAKNLRTILGADCLLELGRVDEASLWGAYRAADVLIFPSLYEGFGLPVLEALACGTAVACSDAASLPEVGGEVVEYFDGSDPASAAAAICRSLGQPVGSDHRARRIAHAKNFTWQEHWRACQRIYRQILDA